MSSKNQKKKRSSHKPKANAVTSKRRPRPPSPPRSSAPAPAPARAPLPSLPTTPGPSDSVEPVGSNEASDKPVLVPVTFTGTDPDAWAWLSRWPFLDDTGEPEPTTAVPPTVEPDPVGESSTTVEEEAPAEVFARAVQTSSVVPVSSAPRRSRRVAAVVFLAAAAVVVAGGMAWLAKDRGTEGHVTPTVSDAYAAPVHLPPSTSYVRSRVLPSGELEVTHWIHARFMVGSLTLRTPRALGLAPGSVSTSHIVLVTDGTPYPAALINKESPSTQTFWFALASKVYLRYRLSGVVQASGARGRALARITSLDVTTDAPNERTTQRVVGAHVLALACSSPTATALPQPCGVERDGSWHVALGRNEAQDRVMAQLEFSADGTEPVSSYPVSAVSQR